MRESTRRLSVPVAEPAADSGQDVLDGALRVAQLNEDARWQFLLAEDTVNTARQTLRKLAAGEPLERVETLPLPAVTAPVYQPPRAVAGFIALATGAAALVAVMFAIAPLSPDTPQAVAANIVPAPDAPSSGAPAQRAPVAAALDLGAAIYAPRFAAAPASETQCLARAVYYEARGEGIDGQIAVAQVVMNRARSAKWADSICGVIQQGVVRGEKCQFSFSCNGHLAEPSGPLWEQAQTFAGEAITGHAWLRELAEATHYATSVSPVWRLNLTAVATIGSHVFYRENDGLKEAHGHKAITGVQELRPPPVKPKAVVSADKAARATSPAASPAATPGTKKTSDDWAAQMFRP